MAMLNENLWNQTDRLSPGLRRYSVEKKIDFGGLK